MYPAASGRNHRAAAALAARPAQAGLPEQAADVLPAAADRAWVAVAAALAALAQAAAWEVAGASRSITLTAFRRKS